MINWKLRLQNRTTLTTAAGITVAIVYQFLSFLGVVPTISQEEVVQFFGMVISLAALLGIVTDPTTHGVKDSDQALGYSEPSKGKE